MGLTKLSLKRPVSSLLIIIALVVFGVSAIFNLQLELSPDMEMPMLIAVTTYPGADPQSVEELVSKPIEGAGSALSGVSSCTTVSNENYSMVLFVYDYGTDIKEAYLDLRAALDGVSASLPADAQDPYVIELNVNALPTAMISARARGDIDLLSFVNDEVVAELETLPGVAEVAVSGGDENYIRVLLKEEMMAQYGLTMDSVAQYIAAADFTIPAGSVTHGSQDVSVSAASAITSVGQIRRIPVVTAIGAVITLDDIAEVTMSKREASSISRYNGEDSISLSVTKKQSHGTVDVAQDVQKKVEQLSAANEAVELKIIYNASNEILSALSSIGQTLLLGVFFAMLVLFIFFGDIRASLIVGASMPISLMLTLILMNFLGFSLNIVTAAALVIAIGMIVDNSIVVLESCFRSREKGLPFREAALDGAKTVMASIVASTLTTVVVYLPLSFMQGLSGQIFVQMGLTIVFAMLASLLSAVTVVPLAYSRFCPQEKAGLAATRMLEKVNGGYDRLIRRLLPRKKRTVLACVGLLILSLGLATLLDVEMMPASDDGSISIACTFRSGTRLSAMDAAMEPIETMVIADDGFGDYNLTVSENTATLTAYRAEGEKRTGAEAAELYTRALADVTNMEIAITAGGGQYSGMMAGGVEAALSGQDLDALREGCRIVQESIADIPGVLRVSTQATEAAISADIVIDPLKAMSIGLPPAAVSMELYNTLSGKQAAEVSYGGNEYSVRLEYPAERYNDINALLEKPIATPYGGSVTLGEIAEIRYTEKMQSRTRVDGVYQMSVTAQTTEAERFSAEAAIRERIGTLALPAGVSVAETQMQEMQTEEFTAIGQAIATAVFLVFLVMAMQFESPRFSLMVMLSIPFSLIGSFLLLFLLQETLSMVSLMGFLMLSGIVVNNGILFVDTANQLKAEMPVEEALIASGKLRLRPILMTTLTTILAMIPMVISQSSGALMMRGMSLVIIGGLVASTLLILIMLPTFYLLINKDNKEQDTITTEQ